MNSSVQSPKGATLNRFPDGCPLCHYQCSPTPITEHKIPAVGLSGDELEVVFLCPRYECQRLFIARYRWPLSSSRFHGFLLAGMAPVAPQRPVVPPLVAALSPTFVEVLGEALHADALSLQQVAGVGLRKALEYLVKDFCIAQHPDRADEIKALFLARCIDSFISDGRIVACAKRAVWLGNDETHYVRRWETHDVSDLKALLELTVSWIDASLRTDEYLRQMPDRPT